MRKFLVKHEDSLNLLLFLWATWLGLFIDGIATLILVQTDVNFPRWIITIIILNVIIPLILLFVIIPILTKGLVWVCPQCGFRPPRRLVSDLDGAHAEENRETRCEHCGVEMTIMKKEQIQRLSALHSHQGPGYMLEFSPFDPEYKK